jgi:hypothetical protein
MAQIPPQSASASNPPTSESAARKTLESLARIPFADAQWQRVRAALLAYVTLLRDWRQQAGKTTQLPTGTKVVSIQGKTNIESPLDKAA